MTTIVRTELRRTAAVGMAVLTTLLAAGTLLTFPQGFAGRWIQAAVSLRLALLLIWPLTLAAGAWIGMRENRYRVEELLATTARPRLQRATPLLAATALTAALGYLLVLAVLSIWVVPTSGYLPAGTVAIVAVGALSCVAAAWLGLAAGRALPRLVVVPALAVISAGVVGILPVLMADPLVGATSPKALLLSPVWGSDLDDFQTIAAKVSAAQLIWFAALCATALLLFTASRRTLASALAPLVVGLALTLALLPSGGSAAARVANTSAAAYTCTDVKPVVCLSRVHSGMMGDVQTPVRQALTMMQAKLPGAPRQAVENLLLENGNQYGPGATAQEVSFGPLSFTGSGHVDVTADDLRLDTLMGAFRGDCGPVAKVDDAQLATVAAAAWLSGSMPGRTWMYDAATASTFLYSQEQWDRAEDAYRALLTLPPTTQRQRVSDARKAALDCRYDDLAQLLMGGHR